ncbi:MAG: response regulator [Candidatus Omnitrophica bacterium]|nr:response regulator [Candidatus Omnitrophota bacterium]
MAEKTRVLIVDDDVNFCNTLSKVLAKKGYETTTANSGASAIEIIKKQAVDTVLMDIKMPVMNGVETYKQLKVIRSDIRVILMTAFSVEDLIRDALKEGVYAVVRKPFDMEMVINMIEKSKNGALVAIVDDNPNICTTMKKVLENKGYSVSTCLTGEEAIVMAKQRPHNIFFIDMKLPVLNGLETYLEIKKVNPAAIVMVMTAHRQEMDDLVAQAIKNGAYICLYKPFDMNEAIRLIDEISGKAHKRD